MSEKEQPFQYHRRVRDTKKLAQRINLLYYLRPNAFRDWRRRLTLWLPLLAAAAIVPFVLNVGGGERVFSNGPLSKAHTIFEQDCSLCHTEAFSSVPNGACTKCHDGSPHVSADFRPSKQLREPSCGQCHVEHNGMVSLAAVPDGNCTQCHASLSSLGPSVHVQDTEVSSFREQNHPDFPDPNKKDARPLRLNHAVHVPAEAKQIRNIELPMKCGDCHETDRGSPTGDLIPVTFEKHCRRCHEGELQFDIFQLSGADAKPAPHTKDPRAIHDYISEAYQELLAANPGVRNFPLERGAAPEANSEVWLRTIVERSEVFLFDRKCVYCHEYEGRVEGYPVVKAVQMIQGQYDANSLTGAPWLDRAGFSHRSHRAVTCTSCHAEALSSRETSDVLIPAMKACLACHGDSGTSLGYCSQCHTYHDKSVENDKDRRPIEDLVGRERGGSQAGEIGDGERFAVQRDNRGPLAADGIVNSR